MPIEPVIPANVFNKPVETSELDNIVKIGKNPNANLFDIPRKTSTIAEQMRYSPNVFIPDATSKYDDGVILGDINNAGKQLQLNRFAKQSGSAMIGNTLGQIAGTVTGDIIGGFGALLEFPVSILAEATGQSADFENFLTRWGDGISTAAREGMPVYRDNDRAFDVGSAAWWLNGLPSVASTISILIPAMGQAKAMSWAGKMLQMQNTLAAVSKYPKVAKQLQTIEKIMAASPKTGKVIGDIGRVMESVSGPNANRILRNVNLAASQRVIENYREAAQTWSDIFDTVTNMSPEEYSKYLSSAEGAELYDRLKQDGDSEEVVRERIAQNIAAKSAWTTFGVNSLNFGFDYLQVSALTKAFKIGTRSGLNYNKAIAANAKETAKLSGKVLSGTDYQIAKGVVGNKAIWNAARPYLAFAGESLSEGAEELVNAIGQNEGAYYGKSLLKLIGEKDLDARLGEYLADPMTWEQGFWGTIGGATFQGVAGINNYYLKNKKGLTGTDDVEAKLKEISTRNLTLTKYMIGLNNLAKGRSVDGTTMIEPIKDAAGKEVKSVADIVGEQSDELVRSLAANWRITANHSGNADLLDMMVDNEDFKTKIATDLEGDKISADSFIKTLKDTFASVDTSYNEANKVLHSRVENDAIRQIMLGKYVRSKIGQRDASAKVDELNVELTKLKTNDTFYKEFATKEPTLADALDDNLDNLSISEAIGALNQQLVKITMQETNKKLDLSAEKQLIVDDIKKLEAKRKNIAKEKVIPGNKLIGINPDIISTKAAALLNELAVNNYSQKAETLIVDKQAPVREKKKIETVVKAAKDIQRKTFDDYVIAKVNAAKATNTVESVTKTLNELEAEKSKLSKNEISHWTQEDKVHDLGKLRKSLQDKIDALTAHKDSLLEAESKSNTASNENVEMLNTINLAGNVLSTKSNIPITTVAYDGNVAVGVVADPSNNQISDKQAKVFDINVEQMFDTYNKTKSANDSEVDGLKAISILNEMYDFYKNRPSFTPVHFQYIVDKFLEKLGYNGVQSVQYVSKDPEITDILSDLNELQREQHAIDFTEDLITQEEIELATRLYTIIANKMGLKNVDAKGKPKKFTLNFNNVMKYLVDNALTEDDFVRYFDLVRYSFKIVAVKSGDKFRAYPSFDTINKAIPQKYLQNAKTDTNLIHSSLARNSTVQSTGGVESMGVFLYDLSDITFTRNKDGDLVVKAEDIDRINFLINELAPGAKIRVRVNTEYEGYESTKDSINQVPIIVEVVKGENDTIKFGAIDTIAESVEYVTDSSGVRYAFDGTDYFDDTINNETVQQGLEDIYQPLLEWFKLATSATVKVAELEQATKELLAADKNKILDFLLNKHGANNKIVGTEVSEALLHFSKVLFYKENVHSNYANVTFDLKKIQANMASWRDVLVRDFFNYTKVRNTIGANTAKVLEGFVSSKTSGNIITSLDADGKVLYRELTDTIESNIDDIQFYIPQDNVAKMVLVNPDTNETISDTSRTTPYQHTFFVGLMNPAYLNDPTQRIPAYIKENSVGRKHLGAHSEYGQQVLNKLYDLLDELADLQINYKAAKDGAERSRLQEQINTTKDTINQITYIKDNKAQESDKFLKVNIDNFYFTYHSEDGKVIHVRYHLFNENGTVGKNLSIGVEEKGVVTYETISNENKRDVFTHALSNLYGHIQKAEFYKGGFVNENGDTVAGYRDVLGNVYPSYKHYLVQTGLAMTSVGKLVDNNGNKISNFTPKSDNINGGSPLTAHIRLNDTTNITIATEETEVSALVKKYDLLKEYQEIYDILEELMAERDVKIVIKKTKGLGGYDPATRTITLKESWLNATEVSKSLILAHEVIHALIKQRTASDRAWTHSQLADFRRSVLDSTQFAELKTATATLKTQLEEGKAINPNAIHLTALENKIKANDMIIQIFDQMTDQPRKLEEIITYAFTNTNVAAFLNTIPAQEQVGETPVRTVWQALKDLIKSLIKAISGNTKLDELASLLDNLLEDINTTVTKPDVIIPTAETTTEETKSDDTGADKPIPPKPKRGGRLFGKDKPAEQEAIYASVETNDPNGTFSENKFTSPDGNTTLIFNQLDSNIVDDIVSEGISLSSLGMNLQPQNVLNNAYSGLLDTLVAAYNLGKDFVYIPKYSTAIGDAKAIYNGNYAGIISKLLANDEDLVNSETKDGVEYYKISTAVDTTQNVDYESFLNRGNQYNFNYEELIALTKVLSNRMYANREQYRRNKDLNVSAYDMKGDLAWGLLADLEGNSKFTDKQWNLLNRAVADLDSDNSVLWEEVRRELANEYDAEIESLEQDYADQEKSWDDKGGMKINSRATISNKLKHFINTITLGEIVVDPKFKTYSIKKDGVSTNSITGLPDTLSFKEINVKLHNLLSGAYTPDEVLARLKAFGLSGINDKTKNFLKLHNALDPATNSGNTDLLNAFTRYFNKSLTETHITIISKLHSEYQVKNDIANKTAMGPAIIANKWNTIIQMNLEEGLYDAAWAIEFSKAMDKYYENLNANKSELINLANNEAPKFNKAALFLPFTIDNATDLAAVYETIGINIDPNIILNTFLYNSDGNYEKFMSYFIKPLTFIKRYGNPKTVKNGLIDNHALNPSTSYDIYGTIYQLAGIVEYYSLNLSDASSTDIKGNVVWTPQWHHFVSDFMQQLKNKNESFIFEYAEVLGNNNSLILWGDEYIHDRNTGYKKAKSGKGVIDYTTVMVNGVSVKRPYKLNDTNIDQFKFFEIDGMKNQNYNKSKEYEEFDEFDWHVQNLYNYLQSINKKGKKDNLITLPIIVNSDRSRFGFIEVQAVKFAVSDYDAFVAPIGDPESQYKTILATEMFKALKGVLISEMQDMADATSIIFEVDGLGLPVRDVNGRLTIKQDVLDGKINLQKDYHFKDYDSNGKPIILDSNGAPTGNVFTLNTLTYIKSNNAEAGIQNFQNSSVFVNGFPVMSKLQSIDTTKEIARFVVGFVRNHAEQAIATLEETRALLENTIDNKLQDVDSGEVSLLASTNFETVATGFALNSFLYNYEQQRLWMGTSSNYASKQSFLDTTKRAAQLLATKSHSARQGTYASATIQDVKLSSNAIEHILDTLILSYEHLTGNMVNKEAVLTAINAPDDTKNILKTSLNSTDRAIFDIVNSYTSITTTDGVSFILPEEFIRRIKDNGLEEEYKEIISKLENNEDFTFEDMSKLIQMQKNFYYGYKYNPQLKKFVPNQIKNAEVVLNAAMVKGLQLQNLVAAMREAKLVQVDAMSTEKVGNTGMAIIHDSDGNLLTDVVDLTKQLIGVKTNKYYDSLGKQQDIVDHLFDEVNTLGTQIAKKILDNIVESDMYHYNGKVVRGSDLIDIYFDNYVDNIRESASKLLTEFIDNPADMEGIINGSIKPSLNIEKIRKLLLDEAISRGLSPNIIKSVQTGLREDNINMPLYYSLLQTKWEAVLTAPFTNKVTKQKHPGVHATQMSTVFMRPITKITQSELTSTTGIEYRSDVEFDDNYRLKTQRIDGEGNVYKAQVFLPRWTKNFYKDGQPITIDDLYKIDPKLLTMVGYRIPTEDKHSTIVFEVVGFLPEGTANIVLPDDFIIQGGPDFDIDTLYTMMYNAEYINGELTILDSSLEDYSKLYKLYVDNTVGRKVLLETKDLLDAEAKARIESLGDAFTEQELDKLLDAVGITRRMVTDKLAAEGKIIAYSTFRTYNLDKAKGLANNRKFRENSILDVFVSILEHPSHGLERLSPNGHPDISDAQREVESWSAKKVSHMNPTTYFTQSEYRRRNMSGKTLKAFSVSRDGFLSIAQRTGAKIEGVIVEVEVTETGPTSRTELDKNFVIINYVEKNGKTYAAVVLNHIGNNASNTFTNLAGKLTISYSAQTTAHILDGVKDVLPDGVNPTSFGIFKTMIDIGIPYLNALAFLNEPSVKKLINAREASDRVIRMKPIKDDTYDHTLKLYKLVRTRDGIVDEEIDAYFDNYKSLPANLGTDIMQKLGIKIGYLPAVEDMKRSIMSNKVPSTIEELQHALNVTYFYRKISVATEGIAAVNSKLTVDKLGAGPTLSVTRNLINDLSNPTDVSRSIMGVTKPLLEEVYAELYESTGSSYAPLLAYLKYSNILSYNILKGLFITELPYYVFSSNALREVILRDKNSPRVQKQITTFINKELYKDLPFFNLTAKDIKRLFGVKVKTRSKFDFNKPENIDAFKKLSLANKIKLYEDHLLKNGVSLEGHLFNNLRVKYSPTIVSKKGYTEVLYSPTDMEQSIVQSASAMWYSDNPYERDIVRDLVRYAYFGNDMAFTYNSVAKILDVDILALPDESVPGIADTNLGIGLADHLERKFAEISRISLADVKDGVVAPMVDKFNYSLHNYLDDRIIPSVQDTTVYAKTSSGRIARDEDNEPITKKIFIVQHGVITVDRADMESLGNIIRNADLVKLPVYIGNKRDWKVFRKIDISDSNTIYYVPVSKYEKFDIGERSLIESNNVDVPFEVYYNAIRNNDIPSMFSTPNNIIGINFGKIGTDPLVEMLELEQYVYKYGKNKGTSKYDIDPNQFATTIDGEPWNVPAANNQYGKTVLGWYLANVNDDMSIQEKLVVMGTFMTAQLLTYPEIYVELSNRGGLNFIKQSRYVRTRNLDSEWEGLGEKSLYIKSLAGAYAAAVLYFKDKVEDISPSPVKTGNNKELPSASTVKPINIKTDKSNPNSLANRLTNPNWYAKDLYDVETEYKLNSSKVKAPTLNKEDALRYDMNLMYQLQLKKFRQNPELIDEINAEGGLDFIVQSSHLVGVKNSRWEGVGLESNFIKVLARSYETVAKELNKFQGTTTLPAKPSTPKTGVQTSLFNTNIFTLKKIISGAQFGADWGGIIGAAAAGLETGGTAPRGYKADYTDKRAKGGTNSEAKGYGVTESEFDDPKVYPIRTMKNVDDADGTIAFSWGKSAGTDATVRYANTGTWKGYKDSPDAGFKSKPILVINHKNKARAVQQLDAFIREHGIETLNVAGHRETSYPGIEEFVMDVIYTVVMNEKKRNPSNTFGKGVDVETVVEELKSNNSFISLTEDKKQYYNSKTNQYYTRVTSFISSETITNTPLLEASQIVGTKVDTLVRDIMSGKVTTSTSFAELSTYTVHNPDAPNIQQTLLDFVKGIVVVKNALEARGEIIVANDIVVYDDVLKIAGQVDILTYTKEGKFRIYDIKTMRGDNFDRKNLGRDGKIKYDSNDFGESKRVKHQKQLSVYNILMYNTHGVKASQLGILPIEVYYEEGGTNTSVLNVLPGVKVEQLDSVKGITFREQAAEYESITIENDVTGSEPVINNITTDELIDTMVAEGDLFIECTTGSTPQAKNGMLVGSKGYGDWEIITDLKGLPKHSAGGVDLSIGNNGSVNINNKGSIVEAKDGIFIDNPPYKEPNPTVNSKETPEFPYEGTSKMYDDKDYDVDKAKEIYDTDESGHLPSVDYRTGEWLKGVKYPTAWKELSASQLNLNLSKEVGHPFLNINGRLQYPKGYNNK